MRNTRTSNVQNRVCLGALVLLLTSCDANASSALQTESQLKSHSTAKQPEVVSSSGAKKVSKTLRQISDVQNSRFVTTKEWLTEIRRTGAFVVVNEISKDNHDRQRAALRGVKPPSIRSIVEEQLKQHSIHVWSDKEASKATGVAVPLIGITPKWSQSSTGRFTIVGVDVSGLQPVVFDDVRKVTSGIVYNGPSSFQQVPTHSAAQAFSEQLNAVITRFLRQCDNAARNHKLPFEPEEAHKILKQARLLKLEPWEKGFLSPIIREGVYVPLTPSISEDKSTAKKMKALGVTSEAVKKEIENVLMQQGIKVLTNSQFDKNVKQGKTPYRVAVRKLHVFPIILNGKPAWGHYLELGLFRTVRLFQARKGTGLMDCSIMLPHQRDKAGFFTTSHNNELKARLFADVKALCVRMSVGIKAISNSEAKEKVLRSKSTRGRRVR